MLPLIWKLKFEPLLPVRVVAVRRPADAVVPASTTPLLEAVLLAKVPLPWRLPVPFTTAGLLGAVPLRMPEDAETGPLKGPVKARVSVPAPA